MSFPTKSASNAAKALNSIGEPVLFRQWQIMAMYKGKGAPTETRLKETDSVKWVFFVLEVGNSPKIVGGTAAFFRF